jgi:hypothetical protein
VFDDYDAKSSWHGCWIESSQGLLDNLRDLWVRILTGMLDLLFDMVCPSFDGSWVRQGHWKRILTGMLDL